MATLNLTPNIIRPDDLYEKLIDAHRGLDDAQSMKLNAKLVLILANQIGDTAILDQAVTLARETATVVNESAMAA
jgi:hypothetical protein